MLSVPKETLLKKRLIKNVGIVLGIIIVLTGGGTWLSNYADEITEAEQSQKRQNDDLHRNLNDINSKIAVEADNEKYYNAYIKAYTTDFTLDRQMITGLLADLSKKNHFSNNVDVDISPIKPVENLTLKSGKALASTVNITFNAFTDNSVFNFIHDLQHELPGIIVVSKLTLKRTGDLSPAVLDTLKNQHAITSLVSGTLVFEWVGTSQKQENPFTSGGPANAK